MIHSLYLGRVPYPDALALQRDLVELRHQAKIENTLLLLEHPPVLTLGRNSTRSNIVATDEALTNAGVTIHEINRGGDVTYHGPGQLVGYPIFDLRSLTNEKGARLGPVDFVRKIEEALIRMTAHYGIATGRVQGRTGVWTTTQPEKKIGAIGVHVSRGITSHGFAYNLSTNLQDFQWIIPCGIADREVTSLVRELAPNTPPPTLRELATQATQSFAEVFTPTEAALALPDGEAGLAKLGLTLPTTGVPITIPPSEERFLPQTTPPTRC